MVPFNLSSKMCSKDVEKRCVCVHLVIRDIWPTWRCLGCKHRVCRNHKPHTDPFVVETLFHLFQGSCIFLWYETQFHLFRFMTPGSETFVVFAVFFLMSPVSPEILLLTATSLSVLLWVLSSSCCGNTSITVTQRLQECFTVKKRQNPSKHVRKLGLD